jgi:flagellin-like protein
MRKKRGITPIIATVLLIAMVVVIALIVFLWVQQIGGETITKFDGQNIETVCGKVEFSAEYVNNEISISNTGIVPIFNFKVKVEKDGTYSTKNINDIGEWPDTGLIQGGSFTSNSASSITSDATKIVLIPVLIGTSNKGERTYVCKESQYGYEIPL